MSEEERFPVTILGRHLGTSTGWDGNSDLSITFYNFIPADGVTTLFTDAHGTLNLDLENGLIIVFNEEGNVVEQDDLLKRIKGLSRADA